MGHASLFIDHQESMRLKDLGFTETCLGWWTSDSKWERGLNNNLESWMDNTRCCSAPTIQQVIDWVYLKSGGEICPIYDPSKNKIEFIESLKSCIDLVDNNFN
jgi:hypothetical protein